MTKTSNPAEAYDGWKNVPSLALLIIILLLGAAVVSLSVELHRLRAPHDDPRWTIYQLGFEHQRLQLAAETGARPDEIALRGDLYLSRVIELRDSPALAPLRESVDGDVLPALLQSAQATEQLLDGPDDPASRASLLRQLQDDSPVIRKLMIDLLNAEREIRAASGAANDKILSNAITILWILLLVLVVPVLLLMRNVFELRSAEARLAAASAMQGNILDAIDEAILGVSRQGTVVFANDRAATLLGSAARLGARIGDMPDDGLLASVKSCLSRPCAPHEAGMQPPLRAEVRGAELTQHFLLRRAVIPDEGAGGLASLVVIADVTVQEEAALRSAEYAARLADVGRLLAYAAVSGGIVHEVNQPLAAIRNYAHALNVSLKLREGSEEHLAIASHLCEEVDRAIEIIRNLRRLGPQDADETGACNLREALQESIQLVSMGSSLPPVSIHSAPGDVRVRGSLPLVGQVLVNLVNNALSASAAAGRSGAEVSIITRGDIAAIEVADFGRGVAPEVAETLFSPFSKSSHRGMGLGLAICQRIATTLGGSLSWRNQEAGGAVFTFTIPLATEGAYP